MSSVDPSIWSRVPNEEKPPSRGQRRPSPSTRSQDSGEHHYDHRLSPHQHHYSQHHLPPPSHDFDPSPRSSLSAGSSSTPDSNNSPRDLLAHSATLAPPPPSSAAFTAYSAAKKPHLHLPQFTTSRYSPRLDPTSSLYSDPVSPGGGTYRDPHRLLPYSSTSSIVSSGVTAPAPRSPLTGQPISTPSPTSSAPPPTSSSSSSAQPLLAEIFSGNPRPHYRPPPIAQQQQHQQQHQYSPHHSDSAALLSPPLPAPQPQPSYFAAPPPNTAHGRARSQSSAPAFEKPHQSSNPSPSPSPAATMSSYQQGYYSPTSSSSRPGSIPAPVRVGGGVGGAGNGQADEHGYRPSSSLHFSASLPTTSAVGSPSSLTTPSLRELAPPNSSRGYSPFGHGGADNGWKASAAGTGQSHSFSSGWGDSSEDQREREGRSRFRDQWSSGGVGEAVLSSSANSAGTGFGGAGGGAGGGGGIGMSNLSPFTRDGGRVLGEAPPSSALGDGGWGSLGASTASLLANPSSTAAGAAYRARREYSLGAVGTGRKRSDSAWGRGERLKDMDEDEEDYHHAMAPPTKSGATSRRHSFAAFEPPSRGATTTFGFQLPEEEGFGGFGASSGGGAGGTSSRTGGGGGGFGPLVTPSAVPSNGFNSRLGSSAINDDDLAADLNSLHLNLEAHVAAGEPSPSRFSHVGSMPADYPPTRSSRTLEANRSPPPRGSPNPPASSSSATTLAPVGLSTSPRATAEPFTPSVSVLSSSSAAATASRFFQSAGSPAPLPPTTTPFTATATTGSTSSRFDFGGPFAQPPQQRQQLPPQHQHQQQQGYGRFGGGYGGLPSPVPPPPTQHQYYQPAQQPSNGPLSPQGGYPPSLSQTSAFASYGASSPSLPPPHIPYHQQLQTGYFAAPPPPPPSHYSSHPQHHQQQQQQQQPPPPPPFPPGSTLLPGQSQTDMNLGRGVPLHAIPTDAPLCIVGFKAGRKDLFFVEDPNLQLHEGDLVIVEADRGRDVGKYLKACSVDEVHKFQQHLVELALGQLANPMMQQQQQMNYGGGPSSSSSGGGGGQGGAAGPAQLARMTKECQPKRIYGKAGPADTHALLAKAQDEVKALALVRSKVAQKGLPMEILDAEWQWDRRKLTFYYTADTRVDFRELVRELFRIWKTRVWLCCLDQQQPSFDFQ